MARANKPPCKIAVDANDGGRISGEMSRPMALRTLYICMSPAERADVRVQLDKIDADMREDAKDG